MNSIQVLVRVIYTENTTSVILSELRDSSMFSSIKINVLYTEEIIIVILLII